MILDNLSFLKDEKKNNLQIKLLKENVRSRNLTHAFLFTGNNHGFLYKLALNFAAFINCKNGGCGKCVVCKNTLKGIYPNLFIAEPEGNILTVPIIENIQRFSSRSSYNEGKKIIIIREAETINDAGANKLLKTLEEPDKDCIFMLLAEDKSMLLPTIVSRCTGYGWDFLEDETEKIIDFRKLDQIIDNGIKKILDGRKDAALDTSISIKNFISGFEKDLKKGMAGQIKEAEKNKEPEGYIKLLKNRQKRKIARLKKKVTGKAFDRLLDWTEDIASASLGAEKEALNEEGNFSSLRNIKGLNIEKIFKISEIIEKNRAYLNSSINHELALDNVLLNLIVAIK